MRGKSLSQVVPHVERKGDSLPKFDDDDDGDDEEDEDEDVVAGASCDMDIVQFTTSIYFVDESEPHLTVDVMRLGAMRGIIKVQYYTEDGSAKAARNYKHQSGELVFQPGEFRKSIEIATISCPLWSPTLEYKVKLHRPHNCALGIYLKTARVKIIDRNAFPTSKYAEQLARGEEGVKSIRTLSLLWDYWKLCYKVPGVRWRTLLTLILDQFRNSYAIIELLLSMYLVDVLFNTEDASTKDRLILPDRVSTALIMGCFFVAPMIAVHAVAVLKVHMDLLGNLSLFLQSCLFRKYLNYSDDSRASVAPSEMQSAIMEHASSAAATYVKLLKLVAISGEVSIFSYFTLQESPSAFIFILVMPICMLLYLLLVNLLCRTNAGGGEKELVLRIVAEVCDRYRLISDYFQRPQMNEAFAASAGMLRASKKRAALASLNDAMFPQWLGPGFTGLYIAVDAGNVLSGKLSLGTFLATVSILGSISTQLAGVYELTLEIKELASSVRTLAVLFNKPTDLPTWKAVSRQRRENTRKARDALFSGDQEGTEEVLYKTDLIEIRLQDMAYANVARTLFTKVNVAVPQGMLVAVAGQHGSGKSTLLRLLSHIIFPQDGFIFIPSHLRILHLALEPLILNASAWVNLVFGVGDQPVEPMRIRKILEMMGMKATLRLVEEDLVRVEREGRRKAGDAWSRPTDNSWMESVTYTEKVKLCLARALIMNPEVMVLQRPLHHYNATTAVAMLKLLRAHVEERGLALPEERRTHRRPRTAFFTMENPAQAEAADMTLHIQKDGSILTQSNLLLE